MVHDAWNRLIRARKDTATLVKLPPARHRWNLSPRTAIRLQAELAAEIRKEPLSRHIRYVAGADMAFSPDGQRCLAGVVVYDLKAREVVERVLTWRKVSFAYVPGLLSFREAPTVLACIRKLKIEPDAFMLDGQGIAHPRRMGLASHIGLFIDRPTIGCAKSRLCGEHDEPGPLRGDSSALLDKGERIGVVLRTRDRVKPVYVSIGHRATLASAIRLVLDCGTGYRLPEPTRAAHELVTRHRHAG